MNIDAMHTIKAVGEKCEVASIWEVLGRRWSLLILKNLRYKRSYTF